jgi:hypothetical protein
VPHDRNVELAVLAAHNAGGAEESHRVAQNLIVGRLSGKPGIGERMVVTVLESLETPGRQRKTGVHKAHESANFCIAEHAHNAYFHGVSVVLRGIVRSAFVNSCCLKVEKDNVTLRLANSLQDFFVGVCTSQKMPQPRLRKARLTAARSCSAFFSGFEAQRLSSERVTDGNDFTSSPALI